MERERETVVESGGEMKKESQNLIMVQSKTTTLQLKNTDYSYTKREH